MIARSSLLQRLDVERDSDEYDGRRRSIGDPTDNNLCSFVPDGSI